MSWLLSPAPDTINLGDLNDVTITSIASGEILQWNGSAFINRTLAEAGIGTGSLDNIVEDTTPQLGGDLDCNNFDIDVGDNDFINFGAVGDITMSWENTGSTFDINCAVDSTVIRLRNGIHTRIMGDSETEYTEIHYDGTGLVFDNSTAGNYFDFDIPGSDTRLYLQQAGVDKAWFRVATNTEIRSLVHGANVLLYGEDAGGTNRTLWQGDPDGAATSYYDGVAEFRTQDSDDSGKRYGVEVLET
jgi:hypothetical protein